MNNLIKKGSKYLMLKYLINIEIIYLKTFYNDVIKF